MAQILAVDDEQAMLQLIRRVLEKDGHTCTLVSDAAAVLNMNFSKYDLILLDVMMPGVDGFSLCRQIRFRVDCPILFLTAKTQENDIVQGLGFGADDYITKPFGMAELQARGQCSSAPGHAGKEKFLFHFRCGFSAERQRSTGGWAKTALHQRGI